MCLKFNALSLETLDDTEQSFLKGGDDNLVCFKNDFLSLCFCNLWPELTFKVGLMNEKNKWLPQTLKKEAKQSEQIKESTLAG